MSENALAPADSRTIFPSPWFHLAPPENEHACRIALADGVARRLLGFAEVAAEGEAETAHRACNAVLVDLRSWEGEALETAARELVSHECKTEAWIAAERERLACSVTERFTKAGHPELAALTLDSFADGWRDGATRERTQAARRAILGALARAERRQATPPALRERASLARACVEAVDDPAGLRRASLDVEAADDVAREPLLSRIDAALAGDDASPLELRASASSPATVPPEPDPVDERARRGRNRADRARRHSNPDEFPDPRPAHDEGDPEAVQRTADDPDLMLTIDEVRPALVIDLKTLTRKVGRGDLWGAKGGGRGVPWRFNVLGLIEHFEQGLGRKINREKLPERTRAALCGSGNLGQPRTASDTRTSG